jgi:hypothetical protein
MRLLISATVWLLLCVMCWAGPSVVVHPKTTSVKIWDDESAVLCELVEPKQIGVVQDAFRRAKRIRNNATQKVRATHKLDFADRWLIDIDRGEIAILTKAVTDVYKLDPEDLVAVRALIPPKAEPGVGADSR